MLWLPSILGESSVRIPFSTFIDYESVFGEKPSVDGIVTILKTFRRDDCLVLLAKICTILSNEQERSKGVQHYLTKTMFGEQAHRKLWSQAQAQRPVAEIAFAERSVLDVLQLAVVHCKQDLPPCEMKLEERAQIAKACLAMNYLYLPILSADLSSCDREKNREFLNRFIVQDLWFRRFERFTHALPRYWELFCKDSCNGEKGLYFRRLFTQATGATFEEHAAVSLALWTKWRLINIRAVEAEPDSCSPIIDPETFFESLLVDQSAIDRILANYVQPVRKLRARLERNFAEGFDPLALYLAQQPLLSLEDNSIICASPRLFYERMTSGQYWQILDGLPDENVRKRFLDQLGPRFEDYVFGLFQRLAGSSRCHRIHYNGELADVVVEYPECLLFVEVKTGRPKEDTIRQGDLSRLLSELRDKSILLAAEQIAGGVRAFLSGRCSVAGRTARDFVCIYPLVVLLRPLQFDHLTWSELDRQKEMKGFSEFATLKPLQVICCEELEMMQTVCEMRGLDLPSLLEEKIAWDGAGRCWMKNFLIEKFGSIPTNAYLRGIADGIFKDLVGPLLWPPLD